MRAGILVLGPLLAKNKKAKVSSPGGRTLQFLGRIKIIGRERKHF